MIYLLEDDSAIRELVAYTLTSSIGETRGFERAPDFRAALEKELPELIILDVMLPGEDGLSVLRSLRRQPRTAQIPVMMLTARSSEYDKVLGLDMGADDYLTKPFGMMELISRVRALLRRTARQEQSLSFGEILLDKNGHSVTVCGQEVLLTCKEFELLRLLMEHPRQAFTRNQLLDQIWGYEFDGESRTVDVHIRTLRQKLGAAGEEIQTLRGVGYRLGGSA